MCRRKLNPRLETGDESCHAFLSMGLASINIDNDQEKVKDDLKERVEIFRKSLTDTLINKRDNETYFHCYLCVDYDPCKELRDAAADAGIPESLFSVKSNVTTYVGYVISRFGYSSKSEFHYKLPNDDWLVTTLSGSDMDKIINHVANGNELGLKIDKKN